MTAEVICDVPGATDEFDLYLTGALRNQVFADAWERARIADEKAYPSPLAINGREYRHRQMARRRRKATGRRR
jgi:hypothetical protein